ncbi:MAG: 5'-nucleotidase C-terminal domain-containing protein [Defluviitaleaceae bacterium]|nr:5'-nucleotidase C-terminal domain-containing protein [Defluviitaleaceae bacterium]
MTKKFNKTLSVFLVICFLVAILPITTIASNEYDGKTVILFTGNIRGDISVLPQIAAIRADFEARGADVILVDTGNFLQGTEYSSFNNGSTMITLMIATGYDVVALGKYDFAFGTGTIGTAFHGDAIDFGPLGELLSANPEITAISANISGANEFFHSFSPAVEIRTPSGVYIGFYGITDPATQNHILETHLAGLEFTDIGIASRIQINALAHSHLVFRLSDEFAPAPGTANAFILDNATGEYTKTTINLNDFEPNPDIRAVVEEFRAVVHEASTRVGISNVTLNGSITANRGGETNLGNFWADALRWFAVSGEINAFFDEDDIARGNDTIHVDTDHIVALWNSGNLRDFIHTGVITTQDLRRVLPFPNTVAVIYLTGAELLEQLEASAQGLPLTNETHSLSASLMHVSGIEYTIDISRAFNAGEPYRDRIWHTANSVERVTITSINGLPFDENAIYAVITSNANFNGMDISYILSARESDTENLSTITTARVTDDAVAGFITSLPNATITAEHASLQGRITLTGEDNITRGVFISMLYIRAGSPDVVITDRFIDIPSHHQLARAVSWAYQQGITSGVSATEFAPDRIISDQETEIFLYRFYDLIGGQ